MEWGRCPEGEPGRIRGGEVGIGHGLVEAAALQLGLESAAQGLFVVAQVAHLSPAFLDGPLVVLIPVLEVDVADEQGAEEGDERQVADDLRTAEPLSGQGVADGGKGLAECEANAARFAPWGAAAAISVVGWVERSGMPRGSGGAFPRFGLWGGDVPHQLLFGDNRRLAFRFAGCLELRRPIMRRGCCGPPRAGGRSGTGDFGPFPPGRPRWPCR